MARSREACLFSEMVRPLISSNLLALFAADAFQRTDRISHFSFFARIGGGLGRRKRVARTGGGLVTISHGRPNRWELTAPSFWALIEAKGGLYSESFPARYQVD